MGISFIRFPVYLQPCEVCSARGYWRQLRWGPDTLILFLAICCLCARTTFSHFYFVFSSVQERKGESGRGRPYPAFPSANTNSLNVRQFSGHHTKRVIICQPSYRTTLHSRFSRVFICLPKGSKFNLKPVELKACMRFFRRLRNHLPPWIAPSASVAPLMRVL